MNVARLTLIEYREPLFRRDGAAGRCATDVSGAQLYTAGAVP
jgi:hypothetical protein